MTDLTPTEATGSRGAAVATIDDQQAILARLESMNAQLSEISAELAVTRAAREQWQELAQTLVPVTRGAMEVATRELSELEDDVSIEDVARLARTTARAVPTLEALMAQLGSVSELGHEVNSLSTAGVARLTEVLQTAEERGYFMFARQGAAIADRVVTAFDEQDVEALGDNVVTILNAVKELTQPEVMALVNRTALTIQEVEDTPMEPPSALALLKSIRDPQTRRGLARVLSMLHTVGAEDRPSTVTQH